MYGTTGMAQDPGARAQQTERMHTMCNTAVTCIMVMALCRHDTTEWPLLASLYWYSSLYWYATRLMRQLLPHACLEPAGYTGRPDEPPSNQLACSDGGMPSTHSRQLQGLQVLLHAYIRRWQSSYSMRPATPAADKGPSSSSPLYDRQDFPVRSELSDGCVKPGISRRKETETDRAVAFNRSSHTISRTGQASSLSCED